MPLITTLIILLSAQNSWSALPREDYSETGKTVTDPTCVAKGNNVETAEQLFRRYNMDQTRPCPAQSRYDSESFNCREGGEKLRDDAKDMEGAVKRACDVARQIREFAASSKKEQADYPKRHSALMAEAKRIYADEKLILKDIDRDLDEIMKKQSEVLQGAANVKAKMGQADPHGQIPELQNLSRAFGLAFQNNAQGKEAFSDDESTISGLVNGAKAGTLTMNDLQNVQSPLVREPATVAAAAHDFKQQTAERLRLLEERGADFGETEAVSAKNGKNMDNYAEDKSGINTATPAASQSTPTTPNTADASGLSEGSGGGGGSGSGSGSGGTSGNGSSGIAQASPTNAYPTGSNTANATPGSGATAVGSGSPTTSGSNSVGSGTTNRSLGSSNPVTLASTSLNSRGANGADGSSSSSSGAKIASLDPALKKDGSADGTTNSSGASLSPRGSALRDALAQRFTGSRGGNGGSTQASTGGATGGTGASASSGAVPEGLLPQQAHVASDQPLAAASGSTGGDLGATDFSLAGSDTDAAVKGMLGEMGLGEGGASGGRGPASVSADAPEILAADTGSLFLRTHEMHQRSLRKGLVINGLRAKL